MEERAPKYYILKKVLEEKIENEEFPADEPIPSEQELMEMYQVSRITVRKAVDELVNEGYLYKIQGKGTYVKTDERSSNLFAITSCTEDVVRMGMKPTKKVMVAELGMPMQSGQKRWRLPRRSGFLCWEGSCLQIRNL